MTKIKLVSKVDIIDKLAKILNLYNDTNIGTIQQFVIRSPEPIASSSEWEKLAQAELTKTIEHDPAPPSVPARFSPTAEEERRNRELGSEEPYYPTPKLKINR